MSRCIATVGLLFLTISSSLHGQQKNANTAQPVEAAKAFLATLTPEQKSKASMSLDSEQRVGWHFIPMATRKGLPLMEMNSQQQEAALNLMRTCLSPAGYQQASETMKMESLLKTIEAGKGQNERNPVKYYFTIFGQPGQDQRWAVSMEGHHMSLNFVFRGDKIVDSTPQFFAANPAEVKSDFEGFKKGLALLKPEEKLAFELLGSLDSKQREKTLLPGSTPTEIRAAGKAQPPNEAALGISVAELADSQKAKLKELLTAYSNKMQPVVAQERWQLIEEAGWDKVKFAWSGAVEEGKGHYYIVQGPTFLVEFINVQPDSAGNPANHIHCVWRDMTGDFDLPIQ